ncbi:MAG: hypothetical protein JWL77_1955 [Chthonomonadaceae bacterium]|nr:hypothetical protein [Chthonomonadaceae bacterium]
MKPKHQGGYTPDHTLLCERTLVTLLRGLGPWKQGIYIVGGLAPRYLIPRKEDAEDTPTHIGTTDVDLVLNLALLGEVEAYRRLEKNLKALGFERGKNDEDAPQHFRWLKPAGQGITIVVDLLCDAPLSEGGQVAMLPGERRLSALKIPGAYLVIEDFIEVPVTAERLDDRGIATETIRVVNIGAFLTLKCLAYEDRFEEKDAYDIVYCLTYYHEGPASVASAFSALMDKLPDDLLLKRALDILQSRFGTGVVEGHRKDGPQSYARFLADPGRTERDRLHRRNAATVVEDFLQRVKRL